MAISFRDPRRIAGKLVAVSVLIGIALPSAAYAAPSYPDEGNQYWTTVRCTDDHDIVLHYARRADVELHMRAPLYTNTWEYVTYSIWFYNYRTGKYDIGWSPSPTWTGPFTSGDGTTFIDDVTSFNASDGLQASAYWVGDTFTWAHSTASANGPWSYVSRTAWKYPCDTDASINICVNCAQTASLQQDAVTSVQSSLPSMKATHVDDCAGVSANIVGTQQSDRLTGTASADVIAGRGGDEVIRGLGGEDVVCGDGGDDVISGGKRIDQLFGGRGDDRTSGDSDSDFISGDTGDDDLDGGDGSAADILFFGLMQRPTHLGVKVDFGKGTATRGTDVDHFSDFDTVVGTDFDDVLIGDTSDQLFVSILGDDVIDGANGADGVAYLFGSQAVDVDLAIGTPQERATTPSRTLKVFSVLLMTMS